MGLEEGKQFTLAIRDTKGDAKAAEEAAKNLEKEKVNLLYTTQTSVTLATKRVTADIPIVFCAGADPVVLGLVDSFAKPGGRLTGVFYRDTDLTGKRLELLKEIVPKLRRVVTFYDPVVLCPSSPPNWCEKLRDRWESSLQSGTLLPSRSFRRVCER